MSVHFADIEIDEEEEDPREMLFERIDNFVNNKLGLEYQSYNSYLKCQNKNNKMEKNNAASASSDFTISSSDAKTFLYKKTKPIKDLEFKESIFKSHESIMKKVRKKFKNGYYTDIVTQMKLNSKRKVKTKKPKQTFDDEDSSSESEDEEAKHLDYLESIIYQKSEGQISTQYWQMTKMLRYIRISNVQATILCLCYINNNRLKSTDVMRAMEDSDGIALLLNILGTNDLRARIGSLKILRELSTIMYYCRNITFLGGIQPLVENLMHHNQDLQCLAAEILAKLAVFKRARSNIRRCDGINHLVYLLDVDLPKSVPVVDKNTMKTKRPSVIQRMSMKFSVTQNAATALWKVSKSRRNRICMRRAGVIPLLAKLLKTDEQNILIPVIGTLQQCSSELYYRISIHTEGMLPILIRHLSSHNVWLRTQCALTLFKVAIDEKSRMAIRDLNGVEILIANIELEGDRDLLYAVTGALWKLCICTVINKEFIKKGGTQILLNILESLPSEFEEYYRPEICASEKLNLLDKPERIIVNVTGALQENSKVDKVRKMIYEKKCIKHLIDLLQMDEEILLINTLGTLKHCTQNENCLNEINRLDGIPRLFAKTRHPKTSVVAASLAALRNCFLYTENCGKLIKSLTGSIELTVKQLESTNTEILTSTCSLIAEIGKEPENVAVLSDLGVVRLLSRLVKTDNDELRYTLADAIAICCDYKDNREQFGRANVITPLVNFLRSSSSNVHTTAARALYKLSQDVSNSREMNQAGVSHLLINMIGSENPDLQMAAAGAIGNLRKLGIETEKQAMIKKMKKHRRNKSKEV